MIESLRNNFTGGWNTDADPRMVKPNQFTDAQDVEVVSDEQGGLSSISPLKSMEFKYEIPDVPPSPCVIRLEWKSGVAIGTRIYDANDNQIVYISPSVYGSATSYITAINNILSPLGYAAVSGGTQVYNGSTFIKVRFTKLPLIYTNFRVVQYLDGVETDCPYLQYGTYGGNVVELASATVDSKAFILSSGDGFGEIGVYSQATGYVPVYRSNKTVFSTTNPIDVRVEKNSANKYAVYFTDNNLKPKVLYIQNNYSTLCTHKYTMTNWGQGTDGYIVLSVEDQQTNLQVSGSNLFISFKEQIQTGGFLMSGGYRYAVRAGINGTQDVTQWSFLTPNVTPVFETNIYSPNAFFTIQGTPGVTTTKVNVLTVEGINKYVFNFIEVAAVYYAGQNATAASAVIIGRYDTTSNKIDVSHIGNEIGTNLSTDDLPEYDDIILKAENLEIKKNRLNLANVELAIDEDLSTAFSSAIIKTEMEPLAISGALNSSQEIVLTTEPDWTGDPNQSSPYYRIGTTLLGTIGGTNSEDLDYTSYALPLLPSLNNKNGSYNVESFIKRPYTWSSSFPAGVMRVDISYKIQADIQSTINYGDPYIDFNLEIWKKPLGGSVERIWSRSESSNFSNDETVYTVTTNIEGGPGDVFEFMYQIRKVYRGRYLQPVTAIPLNSFVNFYFGSDTGVKLTYLNESLNAISAGEYLDPYNCSNKVGYMLNESYPFFVRVHYKNGYISSPYYIGTHKFQFESSSQYANKILTNSPTYIPPSLDGTAVEVPLQDLNAYAYYAKILNIPIASLKGKADYISIWRGECNPSVLGTGVVMAADRVFGGKNFSSGLFPSKFSSTNYAAHVTSSNDARKFGVFLSPDTKRNKTKYAGGKLIKFGCPNIMSSKNNILGKQVANVSHFGSYVEYYGTCDSNEPEEINILDGNYFEFGSESQPIYNSGTTQKLSFSGDYNTFCTGSMAGVALTLSTRLNKSSLGLSDNDNGIYMAQYVVDVQNQYDIQNVRIVPTGSKVHLSEYPDATTVNVNVFGGDTYTQKNYIRLCYWTNYSQMKDYIPSYPQGVNESSIFSSFIGYYGQARYNAQLTYNNGVDTPTFTLQGQKTIYDYLFPFEKIDDVVEEQFNYDSGFSAPNLLNRTIAYNTRTVQPSKLISRIYYTDKKPVSAVSDIYRRIKRSSYRDLDPKNGPIHGIIDQGDHMVALQTYAVTPLVYNTDAFATTSIGAVQTTTGDVYPLNQTPVSAFGPSTKSAVLKGMNRNGNVTTYWVSDWSRKILRYGYDGVSILSDQFNIRSYLLNNMSTSNAENDIVMGYRPRNQQMYISFKNVNVPSTKITIGWNETGNFFTGRYSFTPFRFFTHDDYLFVNQPGDGNVYSIGTKTGTDVLKWYGSSTPTGRFVVESSYNKMPEITKRAFAFALNVTEDPNLVFPDFVRVSSLQYTSTTSNFEHRRGELVATSIADGNHDIMGQYIKLRVETTSDITLLAMNLKVGYKRRLI